MAHVGEELALGLGRGLGAGLGLSQVRLQFMPPRHVPEVDHRRPRPAIRTPDGAGLAFKPDLPKRVARAQEPEFAAKFVLALLVFEGPDHQARDLAVVIWMDVVHGRTADHVVCGIAQGGDRGRGVEDPAARAQPDHDVGHIVGEQAELGLALGQGLLPGAGLRDVQGDAEDGTDTTGRTDFRADLCQHDLPAAIPQRGLGLDARGLL